MLGRMIVAWTLGVLVGVSVPLMIYVHKDFSAMTVFSGLASLSLVGIKIACDWNQD